jgi:cytochrome bd ubiquinol oxidase subunit II
MVEVIVFVMATALLLYVLLGGADFGAGIVELFTGKKGINTISKAIAPVWEANHVWVILALVILFNGFPKAFASLTTYLHIPLLAILIGIVFRGSSFSFRYYDTIQAKSQNYYSWMFKISSLLTTFFYGVTLGAIILGRIPSGEHLSFYDGYVYPWFNFFSMMTGVFVVVLFAWIASVFLLGETSKEETHLLFVKTARNSFIMLIASGLGIFLVAECYGLHFFQRFIHSYISVGCVIAATAMIPFTWKNIYRHNVLWARLLVGAQTTCILVGWFAIQLPVIIYLRNGEHLTIWNTKAPDKTMHLLMIALIVGVVIIFPAIAFLFKVFKFNKQNDETLG